MMCFEPYYESFANLKEFLMHKFIAFSVFALTLGVAATFAVTPPKVLVVAQSIEDAVSFDPAEGYELTTVQTFNNVYQRLVQSNPNNPTQIVPALAASWKLGADGKSLTFTLKTGAAFASGNPVRPEDVIFSLSRAVKLNKAPAFILNSLGWTADNVDSFLVRTDAKSVTLSWPAKVGASFVLNLLTAPIASIVDQVTVASHEQSGDQGNGWLKTASAGSGSFVIHSYVPHDSLVLDANPKSPAGAPILQSVILRNVADPASRRLLVEQGDADLARDLGADQIAALNGKAGISVLAVASAQQDYIILNAASTTNPDLKNPALWQALRYLVDYDGIANKLLKGQAKVHQAFLPDGFPGALNDNPFKLDVTKAKSILAKAGLTNVRIALSVFNQPPFSDIAQSLQSTFAQAGVTLDLQPAITSEVYSKIRSRTYEASILYWIPDYFDAHSNAQAFAFNRDDSVHNVAWRAGWLTPELSDKTDAAVAEKDPAVRAKLYGAIQKSVQESSPFIFAFQATDQVVLRSNVKGYIQGINADQVYFAGVSK
jgi:peptide/nickel transport system substrate-binding protein